jgi:hypothetical protein
VTGRERIKDKPTFRELNRSWNHVEVQLDIGETPDPKEIEYLLLKGEPLPPFPLTRRYLADMVLGRKKAAQRPTRPEFILEIERWRKAEDFTKLMRRFKRKVGSFEKAFAAYAKQHDSKVPSISRKYWAAVKVCKRNRAEWRENYKKTAQLLGDTPLGVFKRAVRTGNFWDMVIVSMSMSRYGLKNNSNDDATS